MHNYYGMVLVTTPMQLGVSVSYFSLLSAKGGSKLMALNNILFMPLTLLNSSDSQN
jgi:hypothetical protein